MKPYCFTIGCPYENRAVFPTYSAALKYLLQSHQPYDFLKYGARFLAHFEDESLKSIDTNSLMTAIKEGDEYYDKEDGDMNYKWLDLDKIDDTIVYI